MNKQQTAVDWYAIEMAEYLRSMYGDGIINIDILKQAKEMEKEQILDAYECGFESEHDARIPQSSMIYYKQTYGGGDQ
jgi:NADH:ubiquinone oxidoreductase subunit 3 (subunit A)